METETQRKERDMPVPIEVKRFQSYLNHTPCLVVISNDGTLDIRASNGNPSPVLSAAYRCASDLQRSRLRMEADAEILRMSTAEWRKHEEASNANITQ